ncbi:MAG: choice-of-anchor Q domain-containing protein [Kiritimatiellae bacterium]|nr:choice-of-anchor Q domain-containing protein [Kiritimatiellia bacterium]
MKHPVLFVALLGFVCAGAALADTHYVVKDNAGAESPFTNWTTAASNIQQAIDDAQCVASDTVMVSNGLYDAGQTVATGHAASNRVVILKAITVRAFSTNWADTVIIGRWDSLATANGPNAVRGVFITNGASLVGFTVTNGACLLAGGTDVHDYNGGGVCGSGAGQGLVSNCLIIGNNSLNYGGGIAYAVARNCTIQGNSAKYGGGIAGRATLYAQAYDCTITRNVVSNTSYGGGAYYTTISNCIISYNSAGIPSSGGNGGGVYGGGVADAQNSCWNSVIMGNRSRENSGGGYKMSFYNCLIVSNATTILGPGGGLNGGAAFNCTIMGNTVHGYYTTGDRGLGGGIANLTASNCIILGNIDDFYGTSGNFTNNYYKGTLAYCCTTATNYPAGYGQALSGAGNITNDPALMTSAAGPYRLSPDSPCINRGINDSWMNTSVDMDGHRRIIERTVDIGAFEFIHRGSIIIGR